MTEEKNIRYDEFVVGIANKTMSFEITDLVKFSKVFFDIFFIWVTRILLLFVYAPFIAIPTICFIFHNWFLLFGFVGYFIGNNIHGINARTSTPIKNAIVLILLLLFILSILIHWLGILHPFVFIFVCTLYTFFFAELSNNLYDEVAKQSLIKDPVLYSYAVEQKIVKVVKKEQTDVSHS